MAANESSSDGADASRKERKEAEQRRTEAWQLAARVVGPREWENMSIAFRSFSLPNKVARICLVPGPLNRGDHWRNVYRTTPNLRKRRYLLCDFKGCRFASNLPYDLLIALLADRDYLNAEHVETLDRTVFWNLLTPEGLDAMERRYFMPDDAKIMATSVRQYLLRYYGRQILHALCPLRFCMDMQPEKLERMCSKDGYWLLETGLLTPEAVIAMDYQILSYLFTENGKLALNSGWMTAEDSVRLQPKLVRLLLSDAGITAFAQGWITVTGAAEAQFALVSRLLTPPGLFGLEKGCFTVEKLKKLVEENPDRDLLQNCLSPTGLALLSEKLMSLKDFVNLPRLTIYRLLEAPGVQALRSKIITPKQAGEMRDHELRLLLSKYGQEIIGKKYATIEQVIEMMEKDEVEGRTWHHFYHLCSERALHKFKEKEITAEQAFAMDYDDLFYFLNPEQKFNEDLEEMDNGTGSASRTRQGTEDFTQPPPAIQAA
jgi:hypothetical protein